jgi:secreted trypsin-like serine protease
MLIPLSPASAAALAIPALRRNMRARSFLASFAALGCAVLLGCDTDVTSSGPAIEPAFITHGDVDGNRHPAVVLIVMDVAGSPAYRCSGTLIAPKVVLTAGHCAGEPGEFSGMRIFTESDVQNGNNSYPYAGKNTIEAASWKAHPLYASATFFQHDVGVVTLRQAVKLASSDYGVLPAVNQLDGLSVGRATTFTAVGYGLQQANSAFYTGLLIRMFAEPKLNQINTGFTGDYSILLSNNANTGGTCSGDSGGPNYVGKSNGMAGVTSFGLNGSCGGAGGVFRVDRKNVLDFIAGATK